MIIITSIIKKTNWIFKGKSIEYYLLLISFIMLLVSLLFLIIIVFTFKLNYNIFFGLLLGYLFAVIGFGLSVIAIEAMIKMKSVAIYYILFFARMSVYCIPIIIYAIFPKEFNIYTIIFGISFFLFSSIISNMLPINVKNRKEIKNARNKLNT